MEQYMRRLEERDKAAARDADSDEERRRRAEPLLKETAFDRRKVVAVFKHDGSRGHHMSDYIPPEELAKFMEASGDKAAAARAKALQPNTLGADNIGHKLMQKMGWKEGQGLGGSNQGAAAPVAAQGTADGLGLGAAPSGAVEEGDDEFTRYRKRIFLQLVGGSHLAQKAQ
ncbi:splicing factor 4 [Monoraphidium neglectum]|uniref:Splicing factor 4 n=1 Tax=Monoraphidium neglectum TaxID=145388 RepID=A0A0D2MGG8_9CHLO|nr:splicing factor 4 [Monoraphidium neglectum]KIZ02170.1 splicing factor 4 [Monoraphidium neglectum]|eukprot:XP_013901189.1 splicing factor 4 [Monoraphidium neglectum]